MSSFALDVTIELNALEARVPEIYKKVCVATSNVNLLKPKFTLYDRLVRIDTLLQRIEKTLGKPSGGNANLTKLPNSWLPYTHHLTKRLVAVEENVNVNYTNSTPPPHSKVVGINFIKSVRKGFPAATVGTVDAQKNLRNLNAITAKKITIFWKKFVLVEKKRKAVAVCFLQKPKGAKKTRVVSLSVPIPSFSVGNVRKNANKTNINGYIGKHNINNTYVDFATMRYQVHSHTYKALALNLGIYKPEDSFENMCERLEHMYDEHLDWFEDICKYFASLDATTLYALRGYTRLGDTILNQYLRGTLDIYKIISDYNEKHRGDNTPWTDFPLTLYALRAISTNTLSTLRDHLKRVGPTAVQGIEHIQKHPGDVGRFWIIHRLFKDTFWLEYVIKPYVEDIRTVIRNAPPLKKSLYVYRGTRTDVLSTNPGTFYKNLGFLSTSLNAEIALRFHNKNNTRCCIQKILLLKGARVLPLMGISHFQPEMELLLDTNTIYLVRPLQTTSSCGETFKQNDIVVVS